MVNTQEESKIYLFIFSSDTILKLLRLGLKFIKTCVAFEFLQNFLKFQLLFSKIFYYRGLKYHIPWDTNK